MDRDIIPHPVEDTKRGKAINTKDGIKYKTALAQSQEDISSQQIHVLPLGLLEYCLNMYADNKCFAMLYSLRSS